MKKLLSLSLLTVFLATTWGSALANPRHDRSYRRHQVHARDYRRHQGHSRDYRRHHQYRRPHVTVIDRRHRHNNDRAIAAGVAGLAIGAMVGAAVANSQPAYGATVYALPRGCSSVNVNGITYYNCNGNYHQPFMGNTGVYYQVVPAPY